MDNINYIIFKVLSNEATLEEKELFDKWLDNNGTNYAEFNKLKAYWTSHVDYQHNIQEDEAFDRFKKNKLIPTKKRNKRIRNIFISIVSAAAIALLLLTVGQPALSPKDDFTFQTTNEKDTLYLPDSTMVVLNKNSKLNYSNQYNKSERRIRLVGEAYFDVRKNAKVPFIVRMKKCQITVLGTAFNVRAYEKEKNIQATLVRGIIRFDIKEAGNENNNQITLRPNQVLNYNKLTEDISIKHVDAESSLIWMTDIHRYQSKHLECFLNDLGAVYNKQIDISDKGLARTVVSGSFSNNQSIDEILLLISRSVPIKWKINNDTIKISRN